MKVENIRFSWMSTGISRSSSAYACRQQRPAAAAAELSSLLTSSQFCDLHMASSTQSGELQGRSMNSSNNNTNNNWGHALLNPATTSSSSLPPKGPSITLDAGAFPFPGCTGRGSSGNNKQLHHQRTSSFAPQATWIDDTLEAPDGPPKKILHRRSASDTAAFLDVTTAPDCLLGNDLSRREPEEFASYSRSSLAFTPLLNSRTAEFDRLDEEQIISMFGNGDAHQLYHQKQIQDFQKPPSLDKRSSSPSDSNSANEMSIEDGRPGFTKSELEEVQSINASDVPNGAKQPTASSHIDPNMDPKRAKRILANRQSAQRSRVRKLQYIAELERSVTALQTEVSALTPQVAFLDHQRILLNVDNNTIKQRIASLMQDKHFKDAHNDALSRELQRLRQLVQQQQDELRTQLNELNNMHHPHHQLKVETPGTPNDGEEHHHLDSNGFGFVKPEMDEDSSSQPDFSSEELQ